MNDQTTLGYEAEPTDVAAEVDGILADIADPLERYQRATAAQVHHQAVARALADERAQALKEMNDAGLSYQQIADVTLIGTRGRAQQLVEKARASDPS